MQFEFVTASRIIFGPGRLNSAGDLVSDFGQKAFIISRCPQVISDRLINLVEAHGLMTSFIRINHEPTVDSIRELVDLCHTTHSEVIIAIGGGSAIDSAKATAALATNPGDVSDYLEVFGLNHPFRNPSLPVIAIPTTSGTGAEVTRNAVIGSTSHHVKVSLRSPFLLPRVALIDPELTLSVPPSVTSFTGLDALTQLIEPFTCNTPNPLTDAFCQEGIRRVAGSLFQAYDHGDVLDARQDMALASLFSGLALANARLGAVHGLAGPLGGETSAPHGAICACLLPYVMTANLAALRDRAADHPALKRYRSIAQLLTRDQDASADMGVQWVSDFCQHARIPPLSAYGLTEDMLNPIVQKAIISSSMKGNPIILSEVEIRNILQRSM